MFLPNLIASDLIEVVFEVVLVEVVEAIEVDVVVEVIGIEEESENFCSIGF